MIQSDAELIQQSLGIQQWQNTLSDAFTHCRVSRVRYPPGAMYCRRKDQRNPDVHRTETEFSLRFFAVKSKLAVNLIS